MIFIGSWSFYSTQNTLYIAFIMAYCLACLEFVLQCPIVTQANKLHGILNKSMENWACVHATLGAWKIPPARPRHVCLETSPTLFNEISSQEQSQIRVLGAFTLLLLQPNSRATGAPHLSHCPPWVTVFEERGTAEKSGQEETQENRQGKLNKCRCKTAFIYSKLKHLGKLKSVPGTRRKSKVYTYMSHYGGLWTSLLLAMVNDRESETLVDLLQIVQKSASRCSSSLCPP